MTGRGGEQAPFPSRLIAAAVLGLVALGFLLYGGALRAPWYLDDYPAIVENPAIRSLGRAFAALWGQRGAALLSFAVNYRLGGDDPFGYHLVNLAIHCGSAVLVLLLLRRVFRDGLFWPCGGALLFLAHPLQTQAVTYVVQRMTSLSALFFLLALYLYVRSRELRAAGLPARAPQVLACYGGALAAGVLALLSKETAAVLPLALWLFTRAFVSDPAPRRERLLALAPFCLAPLLLAATTVLPPLVSGQKLAQLGGAEPFSADPALTPWHYLVTEWAVLWIYLRLFLLPYGQALDPAYPVVRELLPLPHLAAGLGLAALAWLGWRLRAVRPRLSFAIAWFFLTLAIESSLIPLDPLFEHRLYLPLFGLVIALVDLLTLVPWGRAGRIALGAVIVVMALLTWQRNALWNDPVAFYADNLRQAPQSVRLRGNLALNYLKVGRFAEAEGLLREILALRPREENAYINLSKLLCQQQRYGEALDLLHQGLRHSPASVKLLNNLGSLYSLLRQPGPALDALQRVIALDPDFEPAYTNIGVIFGGLGRWSEAENWHRRALEHNPGDPLAQYNLGLALEQQGRLAEALAVYRRAAELDPGDGDPLRHGAVVARRLGDGTAYAAFLSALQRVDAEAAARIMAGGQ